MNGTLITILVAIISFSFSLKIEAADFVKLFVALPGVSSLMVLLFEHWSKITLLNKEHDFTYAASTHMAESVYSKHATFSEEYIARVEKGRSEMFQLGPSKQMLNIGHELIAIRKKYSAWLTKEIDNKLKPFEDVLIKIGADEHYLDHLSEGEQRSKVVQDIFKSFGIVMGFEKDKPMDENEADLQIDKVIDVLRELLGTNALTKLRFHITDTAVKRIGK